MCSLCVHLKAAYEAPIKFLYLFIFYVTGIQVYFAQQVFGPTPAEAISCLSAISFNKDESEKLNTSHVANNFVVFDAI